MNIKITIQVIFKRIFLSFFFFDIIVCSCFIIFLCFFFVIFLFLNNYFFSFFCGFVLLFRAVLLGWTDFVTLYGLEAETESSG